MLYYQCFCMIMFLFILIIIILFLIILFFIILHCLSLLIYLVDDSLVRSSSSNTVASTFHLHGNCFSDHKHENTARTALHTSNINTEQQLLDIWRLKYLFRVRPHFIPVVACSKQIICRPIIYMLCVHKNSIPNPC